MADTTTYDREARRRIRRDLLAYMAEHKMGVPRLSGKVEAANNLAAGAIAYSNLQRFLADKHHTMDYFVGWCETFLRQQQRASEVEFGEVFRRFLAATKAEAGEAAVDESMLAAIPGTYASGKMSKTTLTIARDTGAGFLRVDEIVILSSDDPQRPHRLVYDGIAVTVSGGVQAVMRNALTRVPKYYALSFAADAAPVGAITLAGESFESPAPVAQLATHQSVRLTGQISVAVSA